MRRRFFSFWHALLGLVLLAVGFAVGWFSGTGRIAVIGDTLAMLGPGYGARSTMPPQLSDEFAPFWETWNLVEHEFYSRTPLDEQRMMRGAIKGMLESLGDQYTVYQEPDLAAQTNDYLKGTSGGIGAYIRVAEDKAFIDKPIANSPAERAGVQAGDQIIKIDDADVAALVANLDINQATVKVTSKIRGEKGTTVRLLLQRGDAAPFELAIVRDEIVTSSVKSQYLDNGIGYIQITDFKATTTTDFDAALRDLLPRQPRGLVLDLRNNPGGYLDNAREVLGRLYSGVALYEEDRDGTFTSLNTIDGPDDVRALTLPMAVLVNGNSASASEIVAGALRDERSATYLVGEKTYGKGSVQNIYQLADQGSARVTFAHWLTPNKSEIHKIGITPSMVVPYNEDVTNPVPCVADRRPAEGQSACADSQLAAALKLLATP